MLCSLMKEQVSGPEEQLGGLGIHLSKLGDGSAAKQQEGVNQGLGVFDPKERAEAPSAQQECPFTCKHVDG